MKYLIKTTQLQFHYKSDPLLQETDISIIDCTVKISNNNASVYIKTSFK